MFYSGIFQENITFITQKSINLISILFSHKVGSTPGMAFSNIISLCMGTPEFCLGISSPISGSGSLWARVCV